MTPESKATLERLVALECANRCAIPLQHSGLIAPALGCSCQGTGRRFPALSRQCDMLEAALEELVAWATYIWFERLGDGTIRCSADIGEGVGPSTTEAAIAALSAAVAAQQREGA